MRACVYVYVFVYVYVYVYMYVYVYVHAWVDGCIYGGVKVRACMDECIFARMYGGVMCMKAFNSKYQGYLLADVQKKSCINKCPYVYI